ncbi:MAG: hypothetical protein EVB11_09965 [Winogradskyella sp.]|nr:MAG: hypothetical protein EVB11_09965 [Winogradskyella sp.]
MECIKIDKQKIVILFFSAFILCILLLLRTAKKTSHKIVNVVGEIFTDSIIDNKDFKLCGEQDRIIQYYAFSEKTYQGEKTAIKAHFHENYVCSKNNLESGYIRVRFIVNCKGVSGRFRLLESDLNYKPKIFSKKISNQLLKATESLKEWKSMTVKGIGRDYYQYLIFRIEKGQIIEILP